MKVASILLILIMLSGCHARRQRIDMTKRCYITNRKVDLFFVQSHTGPTFNHESHWTMDQKYRVFTEHYLNDIGDEMQSFEVLYEPVRVARSEFETEQSKVYFRRPSGQ